MRRRGPISAKHGNASQLGELISCWRSYPPGRPSTQHQPKTLATLSHDVYLRKRSISILVLFADRTTRLYESSIETNQMLSAYSICSTLYQTPSIFMVCPVHRTLRFIQYFPIHIFFHRRNSEKQITRDYFVNTEPRE